MFFPVLAMLEAVLLMSMKVFKGTRLFRVTPFY